MRAAANANVVKWMRHDGSYFEMRVSYIRMEDTMHRCSDALYNRTLMESLSSRHIRIYIRSPRYSLHVRLLRPNLTPIDLGPYGV